MPKRWQRSWWKFCLVLIVLAAASVVMTHFIIVPKLNDIFANISTADCVWTTRAMVWLDDNRDGVRNADEQALPNIDFYVDDTLNNNLRMPAGKSDATGHTRLSIFIAGCPQVEMEYYPQPPEGYCFTTPERIKSGSGIPSEFGFAHCA